MIGSKLEMHVDILRVLSHRGALELPRLNCEVNLNGKLLKEQLDFLIKQGLVEEADLGAGVVYANTERGEAVARFFGQTDKSLSTKNPKSESYAYSIET